MDIARHALLWFADRRGAQRLIASAPVTRRVAARFVAGEHMQDAVRALGELSASGLAGSLNLLGESVTDSAEAESAAAEYEESIGAASSTGLAATVSVKLSQLGLSFDRDGCRRRLERIGERAASSTPGLEVDMEHSASVGDTIATYLDATVQPRPRLALQAYLHRTPDDLRSLSECHARIRLTKGAYLEPPSVALQDHREITRRFAELSTLLLESGTDPAFATHDSALISHVLREARRLGRRQGDFELQFLYGIRRDLQLRLANAGFRVRVYVPFGSAWYPYLVRRLAERPANLRFFARALMGA
jgi:proline dehydrogenase